MTNKARDLDLANYATLVRLHPSGNYRVDPLSQAQAYLRTQLANLFAEGESERALQAQLVHRFQVGDLAAGLCLRCYISHAILAECQALVRQFGSYYGFDVAELLAYVLHDEGKICMGTFKPLGYEILEKYHPDVAGLGTWAARLVRQNTELKRCLKEHGLLLKTDWGLLNEVKPRHLRTILVEYFDEAEAIVRQAVWVHEAYHRVYLPDRATQKGQECTEPTPNQLQRMVDLIQQTVKQAMTAEAVMARLQWSAKRLRQYRLKEQPKSYRPVEPADREDSDRAISDFLQGYQQQVSQCLGALGGNSD
jgi:hypothetical protein